MAMTLFAAIDVGSYELEMKIFEFTSRKGMKQIDQIRHRIELGADTYTMGKIGIQKMEELCKVLQDFAKIMNGYKVSSYRACATSAIREAQNRLLVVDYVRRMTGIEIEILDNSEQHFLDYKAIAFGVPEFDKIIANGTAVVDLGSGSIQIGLFDNDKLVTTQNIRIGHLRIREKMADLTRELVHPEDMIEDLIDNEIAGFKKMYLKDRGIKNLVVGGGYINDLVKKQSVTALEYHKIYDSLIDKRPDIIAREYGIPTESASLLIPSLTICRRLIEEMGAEILWLPGQELSDGIAYDYGQTNKFIKIEHDFNEDIIAAARNIAKRYQTNKNHIKNLENLALQIFDRMKKRYAMGNRQRLLLQIAVILHGCGKYINLSNAAECSYSIIMATEIIGLSVKERRVIANVVKYNTLDFNYSDIMEQPEMNREDYLLITKLTAILRVANACDRSHRQKFESAQIAIKDNELLITVETDSDITLERGLFPPKADYFEEVFHIRPVIRQKKRK